MDDIEKEKWLNDWWNNYTTVGKEHISIIISGKSVNQVVNEKIGDNCVKLL